MTDIAYVTKFVNTMTENGEFVFLSGDNAEDAAMIKHRLQHQGYWAGDYNRYYFDDNLDIIKKEQRF